MNIAKRLIGGLLVFLVAVFVYRQLVPKAKHVENGAAAVDEPAPADARDQAAGQEEASAARPPAQVKGVPPAVAGGGSTTRPFDPDAALNELQSESQKTWQIDREVGARGIRTLSDGRWEKRPHAAEQFVARFAEPMFGVRAQWLHLDSHEENAGLDRSIWQQTYDGVRVFGATLKIFTEDAAVVRVQSDLVHAEPSGDFKLDAEQAKAAAQQSQAGAKAAGANEPHVEKVYFPSQDVLVPAYSVQMRNGKASVTILVNGETGRVIKIFDNRIR